MELVHYVANKFRNSGHQYDDILGIGMVGFTKALNTYKKDKNAKVSTYSIACITNEILHFLRSEKKHLQNDVSAEEVIYEHSEGKALTLIDILSEDDEETETSIVDSENINELRNAIKELPLREQEIIKYRFEMDGRKRLTQGDIGLLFNMTQANVSKLESNIKEKLLEKLKNKNIENYIY